MEATNTPRLIAVDRLSDGVVVMFDDRESFFYSAGLLYSLSPQAEPIDEPKSDW